MSPNFPEIGSIHTDLGRHPFHRPAVTLIDSLMSSGTQARARIWVTGKVQGVGYRAFAQRIASRLDLSGGVRNLDDGRVEVDVEGDRSQLDHFIELLRGGPPGGRVQEVSVRWEPMAGHTGGFHIWA